MTCFSFKKTVFLTLLSFFLLTTLSRAATLELNNGKVIHGDIVELADDYVVVKTRSGIDVTYFSEEVFEFHRIQLKNTQKELKQEINSRTGLFANDFKNNDDKDSTLQKEEKQAAIEAELNKASEKVESKKTIKGRLTSIVDQANVLADNREKFFNSDDVKENIAKAVDTSVDVVTKHFKTEMNQVQKFVNKFEKDHPLISTTIHSIFIFLIKYFPYCYFVLLYVVSCSLLCDIAKKLHTGNYWMAWVYPFQTAILMKMACKPLWFGLFLFLPLFHDLLWFVFLLFWIKLWMDISEMFQEPSWYGILMGVPLLHFVMLWRFAQLKPYRAKTKRKPIIIRKPTRR